MSLIAAIHPLPPGLAETRHAAASVARRSPTAVAELTRRLVIHDEAAFREFHARYFDRIYQFLLVVARGQEHEAQEALQETLLRVARRARVFKDEEQFWCWLKAVARNAARDGGRKRGRYYAMLEKFSLWRREEPVIGEVTEKRLKPALEELLSELSPSDRRLIEAKYLDDESMRDLAAQSGLTEKAVESRLLRLRRKLRERLLKKLNEP